MAGAAPAGPDAGVLAGALADADRRSAFAAVQLGARTLDQVAAAANVPAARAAKALGRLADVGLVVHGSDGLAIAADVFQAAARAALSRPVSDEHADAPADVRKVLGTFVADGRITRIPSAHHKRLVVLDWLVQRFEPGRHYSEQMVNLLIGQAHPDTAALRRYLVDEGFLDRADGEYWRSGGTV
ncbi:MAG TPA: ArsR family transcriptional regulator [Acidimicrobiaceae bacterium]|nr:ArsR family transcriptional regulator [Acidimicrobiaceae bacterium]